MKAKGLIKAIRFETFVSKNLSYLDYKNLASTTGLHPIALGKFLSKPETATHEFLLKISDVLNVHPYFLITEYGVGNNKLSTTEKEYHKKKFKIQSKTTA